MPGGFALAAVREEPAVGRDLVIGEVSGEVSNQALSQGLGAGRKKPRSPSMSILGIRIDANGLRRKSVDSSHGLTRLGRASRTSISESVGLWPVPCGCSGICSGRLWKRGEGNA